VINFQGEEALAYGDRATLYRVSSTHPEITPPRVSNLFDWKEESKMKRTVVVLICAVTLLLPLPSSAKQVSEGYYIQTYRSVVGLHKAIGGMLFLRPKDKSLRVFAYKALQKDRNTIKGVTPPPGFEDMQRRILLAIDYRLAALQYHIKGTPGGQKFWTLGDAQIKTVNAFLAQRKADKVEAPPIDKDFRAKETLLNKRQWTDRYFLIRYMNLGLGTKLLASGQNKARVDHTLAILNGQASILRQTMYPPAMKELHNKLTRAIDLRREQMQAWKAKKPKVAGERDEEVKNIYREINAELTQKHNIKIPKNLQL
jgi:hypothetical protein